MSDFDARVKALVAAQDGAGMAALAAEATSKKERKAVKRGVYLLKQRGVDVPETAPVGPAPGASLGPATLPVLMGPPEPDAGRLFTLALAEGSSVLVLEAYFQMPEGLDRLQGSKSTRGEYLPWAQRMCAGAAAQRVRVDGGMLRRKLWEIRSCVRDDRLGPDVDVELAKKVASGLTEVPHPALSLSLGGARVLTMGDLRQRQWALKALLHEAPQNELRAKAGERGGSAIVGVDSAMARAAADWAEQWGHERIRETALDLASYAAAVSDKDAALTFREASKDPERLIVDYVLHLFG